jgi:acyl-homoserine lactone acylase PvdQ
MFSQENQGEKMSEIQMESANNSPGTIKVPRLNASFFTNYNPKGKLDSIETVRNREKEKTKMRSLREDSHQSHLASAKLEPLTSKRTSNKRGRPKCKKLSYYKFKVKIIILFTFFCIYKIYFADCVQN